jgi:hypothetical protein
MRRLAIHRPNQSYMITANLNRSLVYMTPEPTSIEIHYSQAEYDILRFALMHYAERAERKELYSKATFCFELFDKLTEAYKEALHQEDTD